MKNHQIMIANALILIVTGLIGYISSGSPTALIADGIGVILLILSFPTKNDNAVVAHIAVVLTLITAVMFWIVGFNRANNMILVMAAVTSLAFVFYILNFIKRKKEREAKNTGN
jgi:Ca2+/Na+ antiporter